MRLPVVTLSKFVGTVSLGLLTVCIPIHPCYLFASSSSAPLYEDGYLHTMHYPTTTTPTITSIIRLILISAQGVSYTLSTLTLPSLLFLPTAPSAAQTHAYLKQRARSSQRLLSSLAIASLTLAYTLSPRRAKHPYLLWSALVCGLGVTPSLGRAVAWWTGNSLKEDPAAGMQGSRINMEESGVIVTPPASGSESGDGLEEEAVNGEVVRRGVERGRAVEAARAGIFGVGFFMAVVGLWGDGA